MAPKSVLETIQQAKTNQAKELDLSLENLEYIPSELFELTQLEKLVLYKNRLTTLPESIGQLINLTTLDLSNNQLTILPESLGQLKNLTELNLRDNQLIMLPNSFGQLKNLTELNLSNNQLTILPKSIGQLVNLITLNLWGNDLRTLPKSFGQLKNLTTLNLWRNQLTILPDSFRKLQLLERLNLNNNLFTSIPEVIYEIRSLKILSFNNYEKDISADGHIIWYPSDNSRITSISPKILQLKNLEQFNVSGNPITTPPPDIVEKGIDAIRSYFQQQQEQGKIPLYSAKMLIVGEPGAGKTTLLRKLIDPAYPVPNQCKESTLGVEVHSGWEFPLPNNPEITFSANLWDFGGQQIQYQLHHFFLSTRSLYVLVADDCEQRTDFDYWFRIIELLGGGSPLLVVLNEKNHKSISNFDRQKYRERYGDFFLETRDVDFAHEDGRIAAVRQKIQEMLAALPHVGAPLPKQWPLIKAALEARRERNHIPVSDYFAICRDHRIAREEDQLLLSGHLDKLGIILHFQHDPSLSSTIIVNPIWVTKGVYQLLSDTTVERNGGRFSRAWLDDHWAAQGYDFEERGKLLALMLKDSFELCYKLSDANGGEYLAPQLLPAIQPPFQWDERDNLRFRFQYPFLPTGILSRLIVRLSDFIHHEDGRDLIWKQGVVFCHDGTRARVIEDAARRLEGD